MPPAPDTSGELVPGPGWVSESGGFTGVFMISGATDAKFANPVDGCADLIIARYVVCVLAFYFSFLHALAVVVTHNC